MKHTAFPILVLALVSGALLMMLSGSVGAQGTEPMGTSGSQSVLGTGFVYQGRLNDAGAAANGTYDFEIRLYDAASGGNQVGIVTKDNVTVSGGLFMVELDYGSGALNGNARWLQVGVRPGSSTAGYTTLAPRQPLAPAPYALALPGLWTQPNDTSPNLIGGHSGNSVTSGVVGAAIGGGGYVGPGMQAIQQVSANYGTIGGGYHNTVSGAVATIGGGNRNTVSGQYATIAGGAYNRASNWLATVGGGWTNTASGYAATVPGGDTNTAQGDYSFAAGRRAQANHPGTFVWADSTDADLASSANDQFLVRASGGVRLNVVGGALRLESNATSPNVIGGYSGNSVTSGVVGATIAGGGHAPSGSDPGHNTVTANFGTIGGGSSNQVTAQSATVGGGDTNIAADSYATVAGGLGNSASGLAATVSGGSTNIASGDAAMVPGGFTNTAQGNYSFAAGMRAKANNAGCFVWGDSTWADVTCNKDNAFIIRASGGVTMYTSGNLASGVGLAPGAGSWSSLSDRNVKENLAPVDVLDMVARVAEMPITTWNLVTQDPAIRHIGPMAQDFYAAFRLGEDDRHIGTLDADGVALAAIQGLYQLVQTQDARVAALEVENSALRQELGVLEARLSALEKQPGASESRPDDRLTLGLLASGLLLGLVVVARNGLFRR